MNMNRLIIISQRRSPFQVDISVPTWFFNASITKAGTCLNQNNHG